MVDSLIMRQDPGIGQGVNPQTRTDAAGWAMLPHRIVADERLSAVDVRVIAALLYYSKQQNFCTPCDASIAARSGHISPGTVQRSLRHLEQVGYLKRESVPPTDRNRTGRIIHLLWRSVTGDGTPERRCSTPRSPVTDKEVEFEELKRTLPITSPIQAIPDPPTPALPVILPEIVPVAGQIVAQEPLPAAPAVQPAQSLLPLQDALVNLPGASQDQVRQTAWRVAHALNDTGSIGFYLMVLAQVVAGTVTVEQVVAAFQAGKGAVGKARSAGAIFTWTLRNYQPPPKPSQINQPQYHRAAVHIPEPAVTPLSRDEEVAQLREWLANSRHPCHGYAKRRLKELGCPAPSG